MYLSSMKCACSAQLAALARNKHVTTTIQVAPCSCSLDTPFMLLGEAGKIGVCGYKPGGLTLLAFGSTDTTARRVGGVV